MRRLAWLVVVAGCSNPSSSSSPGVDSDVLVDAPPPEPGLRGEYYRRYHERVLERVDPTIDFQWGDGELAPGTGTDRVSVRWTGFLDVPVAGNYTFATSNDDGVRVTIAGTRVIDDWRFHFPERHEGSIDLPAGMVPILVEYFEIDMTAEMRLWWSSPSTGLAEQIVPQDHLLAPPATGLPAVKPPYENPVIDQDC